MVPYVIEKLRLNKFRNVHIPRNKDLFNMYHPTDTSTSYGGSTPGEPCNFGENFRKNEMFAAGIATIKQSKSSSEKQTVSPTVVENKDEKTDKVDEESKD